MAIPDYVDFDAWFDESIEKIRMTAPPGGDAIDAEECRAIAEHMAELADHAEAHQE